MNGSELLSTLETLDYGRRQKELARLARDLDPASLQALVRSLTSSLYEAEAGLTLASVARRGELLLEGFRWPWPRARRKAALLLADLHQLPEGLVESTLSLDLHARRMFLRKIRRSGATEIAELLIDPIHQRFGLEESRFLIPALSADLLPGWLARAGYRVTDWRTPAGRHPDLVLSYWREELEKRPEELRTAVWYRFSAAVDILALKRPHELLTLARELGRADAVWNVFRPVWGRLMSVDAPAILALLDGEEYRALWKAQGLPKAVRSRLREFNFQDQVTLIKPFAPSERMLEPCLRAVAPGSRAALFQAVTADTDHSKTRWGERFMGCLPHGTRAEEGRRMLSLPSTTSRLEETVSVLSFLPPDESRPRLLELVKNPAIEMRARVRASVIQAAGFYRQALDETLGELTRLANEPDPVKNAVLTALGQLPFSCWSEAHVLPLRSFLLEICQARDTSESTRHLFRRLALRWIELGPVGGALFEFGLESLKSLSDTAAVHYLPSLELFSKERRDAILAATISRVDSELKLEDTGPLFALCRALGERLEEHPDLEKRLEPLTSSPLEHTARKAIAFWLGHRTLKAQRAEKLLSEDPSAIAVSEVAEVLHRRRQDLLTPYLQPTAVKGRFLTGRTIHLLPFRDGFERWLPTQQVAFSRLHLTIVEDEVRRTVDRAWSLSLFGEFGYLGDEPVLKFLDDADLSLREAALGALKEHPELLIARLDKQEARVAVFRLSVQVAEQPPEKAVDTVKRALLAPTKLTSKKELLRLLGLLGELETLELAWREEGQHRDLKIAILHGLLRMFEREKARAVYAEAFESDDSWLVRASLAPHRHPVPPDCRASWVEKLTGLLRSPDRTLSHLIWSTLLWWSEDAPDLLAATAVEGLVNLEESGWRQAVELLVACSHGAREAVREAAQRLIRIDDARVEGRDQPARQRLRYLVERAASERNEAIRSRLLEACREVHFPESRLRFAVAVPAGDWEILAQSVESFEEMEGLIQAVLSEVGRPAWEPDKVLEVAGTLAASPSPVARRLAVEVLKQAGSATRWSAGCRELLERLRADEHVGVAERAAMVVVWAEP